MCFRVCPCAFACDVRVVGQVAGWSIVGRGRRLESRAAGTAGLRGLPRRPINVRELVPGWERAAGLQRARRADRERSATGPFSSLSARTVYLKSK